MMYLSDILNKKLYSSGKSLGKVIDFTLTDTEQGGSLTKLVVRRGLKKYFIDIDLAVYEDDKWIAKANHLPQLPYDDKEFFIAEDLMDKQVIDITGKRLVRVNDLILEKNETFRVKAIDIGFGAVIRRLGLGGILPTKTITLPWSYVEAFDYDTGNVKIRLSESSLNNLHPAEVANILEDAGAKERMGVVQALDPQHAASAIEEADEETQSAILESVNTSHLKHIIERMHISEIVDVLDQVNPFTSHQILHHLSQEKAKEVKKLLIFEDDVAGGMMDTNVYREKESVTLDEAKKHLMSSDKKSEGIVVVSENELFRGVFPVEQFLFYPGEKALREVPLQHHVVLEDATFPKIVRFFAEYNLRILPVVGEDRKVLGVITIDNILARVEEEEEKEDAV